MSQPDTPHLDAWLQVHGPDRVPTSGGGLVEQIAFWESWAVLAAWEGLDDEAAACLREAHALAAQRDRARAWRQPRRALAT